MFIMLFSIEQSILPEETLVNLWSFTKSANVQNFPPYSIIELHANYKMYDYAI